MAKLPALESAIDKALTQVRRAIASGMKTSGGSSAVPHLEKMERELIAQRERALKLGAVDREWFQRTIRWVVEWVPDDELTLVAALGGVVRAAPPK